MSDIKKKEEDKVDTSRSIGTLVAKIEALSGTQKQDFCKTLSDSEKKSYIRYLRDRDMEEIECTFRCHEPAGGSVSLTTRPYEGTDAKWTFIDGQTYKIPLYLAKRMNGDYQGIGTWYPTHAYVLDATGKPIMGTGKKNYRFSFNTTAYS